MATLYLGIDQDIITENVIFSGDPWRIEILKQYLENPKQIAFRREFNTYIGKYKGITITITSTGIGSPSAAIAMEEMYESGMKLGIRMGTVMGLEDTTLGDFIVPTASIREEGTSATYVKKSYPAVADFELVQCMNQAIVQLNAQYHNGITCTYDGFYSHMKSSKLSHIMDFNMLHTFDYLRKIGVIGIDMESSCMFVLGKIMKIRFCVVTLVTVLENLKGKLIDKTRTDLEDLLCRVTLEGIYNFYQKNSTNKGEHDA